MKRNIVLITGTSRGIGYSLAKHFVNRHDIVEGCSRKPFVHNLPNYTHHIVSVTDEIDVRRMISSIRKRHGRLDIIINNAGVASMNAVLLTPSSTIKRIMEINACGTFIVSREGAKLMMKQKYGRIINFSTVAVPLMLDGEAVYAASKSAIETFTKIFAKEIALDGITCNVIGPSPTDTNLINGISMSVLDKLIDKLPIKRMGNFNDIINVIDFFIRPESDAITGQTIYLGGVQ